MGKNIKLTKEELRRNAKANNDLGSREIFFRRQAYSAFAYENVPEEIRSTIKDFNVDENILYGRVDRSYRPVVINPRFLAPIVGSEGQYALPFVADAIAEFLKEIKIATTNGKISTNPILSSLEIARSYVSYLSVQNTLLNRSYDGFLFFEKATNNANKITNIDIYVSRFERFLLNYTQKNIVTSPAFITSRSYDMNSTGLCIDFSNVGFSQDEIKMKFIDFPHFEYYVRTARKYGFYVDANYPLRLVCDLTSPVTKKFMKENGLSDTSVSNVFSTYYSLAYRSDLEIFQGLTYRGYERYRRSRPRIKKTFQEDDRLFTYFENREFTLPVEFVEKYPIPYWLTMYVKVRNQESRMNFSEQEILKITKNALSMEKNFDKETALDYLNKVFMNVPIMEGSASDQLYRDYLTKIDESPSEGYQQHLKEIYKNQTR